MKITDLGLFSAAGLFYHKKRLKSMIEVSGIAAVAAELGISRVRVYKFYSGCRSIPKRKWVRQVKKEDA
jgi:hypothetical protein